MLNNFIYAQTKDLFLEKLNAGEVLDEAIVFIEDTKEIWNHGHYFAGESIDPNAFAQLQTVVADLKEKSEESIVFLDESKITLPFGYIGADSQKYTCVPGRNDCGEIDGYYYGSIVIYLKVTSGTIFEERKISELTSSNALRLNGSMIVVYAQNNHLFVENNTSGNFDIYFKGFHSYQTLPECFIPETIAHTTIPITYSELKSLRDNSQLVPGQQYRITDYVTTTAQENTRSAGHQFDVIVTADNENTLNEVARACLHEGDTYFTEAGANLAAWKIWYCLDNDVERFGWANASETSEELLLDTIKPESGVDASGTYTYGMPISKIEFHNNTYVPATGVRTKINNGPGIYITKTDTHTLVVEDSEGYIAITSGISIYGIPQPGKGVIYRMIDEWNNDCPYDFKNIIYVFNKSFMVSDVFFQEFKFIRDSSIDNVINGTQYYGYVTDNLSTAWPEGKCWVTDAEVIANSQLYKEDGSVISIFGTIYKISNESGEFFTFNEGELNDFSLEGEFCYSNTIMPWAEGLNGIIFKNDKTKGSGFCKYNSFGNDCYDNYFGNGCHSNRFDNNCHSNRFSNYCQDNSFGNSFWHNSFGNSCDYNSFGHSCASNSFGHSCKYNSFGNDCNSNSFGRNFSCNSFGNYCQYNSFGEYCQFNSFGNSCSYNSFRTSASNTTTLLKYCYYNHFDDGCSYNVIWNSDTTSSSIQNINVNRGVSGTSSNYNFINIDILNAGYEIKVAKNSAGEIKVYCEADLLSVLTSINSSY